MSKRLGGGIGFVTLLCLLLACGSTPSRPGDAREDRVMRSTAPEESGSTMALVRDAVEQHNADAGARMLREFRAFLSLPNVAASQSDMLANARWIERYIEPRGFASQTVTAGGAPYVIARRTVGSDAPTLLIYAHFDGQPVAPENWSSPPFEPTLRDGDTELDWDQALAGPLGHQWRIYARSAGDDKAPVIALMHAIDALEAARISIGVNIALILDGEEEAGSPTLAAILEAHRGALAADLMLFCDGPMHQSRRRQLVFGVRGSATLDLTVYGPLRPLHSGHYGGWAPHPSDALVRLLSSLKDERGAIAVDGYFDDVRPVSAAERAAIAAMPRMDEALRDELALGRLDGDGRRLEDALMQPAIVVKGLQAGGVGAASRNIIVPDASASLNLRLVPDQTPEGTLAALERHIEGQGFQIVRIEPDAALRRQHAKLVRLDWRGGYRAFRSPLDGAEARRLARLIGELDGEPPLLTPTMGGSLPIYLFEQALDIPIVILPIANHDNNQHGRDENLRLQNLFDAVAVYAAVLAGWSDRIAQSPAVALSR